MKKQHAIRLFAIMTAVICIAALLQGCIKSGPVKGGNGGTASVQSESAKPGSAAPGSAAAPSASQRAPSAIDSFSAAFRTVDKDPLDENIQVALWLAASNPQQATAAPAGSTGDMQGLADKYAALVADQGVHYVEVVNAMGMKIKTEYWVKGGKFKKLESMLNQVTVYDGQTYVQYDTVKKTGKSASPDSVSAEIELVTKGMLTKMAAAPFQKKKDIKFEKFSCSVFSMDIEVMGMKGETLYVDKATGMLVNTLIGDPKDAKNSMSTYVESLTVGGFGDDVFTVPSDIKIGS